MTLACSSFICAFIWSSFNSMDECSLLNGTTGNVIQKRNLEGKKWHRKFIEESILCLFEMRIFRNILLWKSIAYKYATYGIWTLYKYYQQIVSIFRFIYSMHGKYTNTHTTTFIDCWGSGTNGIYLYCHLFLDCSVLQFCHFFSIPFWTILLGDWMKLSTFIVIFDWMITNGINKQVFVNLKEEREAKYQSHTGTVSIFW